MTERVLTIAPPTHRSECLERYPRCSGARLERWGIAAGIHCPGRCAHRPRQSRSRFEDGARRLSRGFRRENRVELENCRIACGLRSTGSAFYPFSQCDRGETLHLYFSTFLFRPNTCLLLYESKTQNWLRCPSEFSPALFVASFPV